MIHRSIGHETTRSQGRDSDGNTIAVNDDDLMLFDGQQRITAVLLGSGKGQMNRSRRLWVDLGARPNRSSGLKFQLRMTSTGQPFGYRAEAPNQKTEFSKRQVKWLKWPGKEPEYVFNMVTGDDLIDATSAVPFATVWNEVLSGNSHESIEKLYSIDTADEAIVKDFVEALRQTSDARAVQRSQLNCHEAKASNPARAAA